MKKKDMINAVAAKAGITKKHAEEVTGAVFEVITDAIVAGEKVNVPGFGHFESVVRSARTGRNPQTGEEIDIPETRSVKFKVAKALKDAVRN